MADDPDAAVRAEVADNPATPSDVLAALAGDPFYIVRAAVAHNPSTPPATRAVLADDGAWLIRTLAQNPALTTAEILAMDQARRRD
nr:hypothetical protein [Sulfobacillus harzensis]